jgi:hypothetical protein
LHKISGFIFSASLLLLLAACHDEGPAQKAGSKIDNAAQSVSDAISPPGPIEKAGRAIDKAVK